MLDRERVQEKDRKKERQVPFANLSFFYHQDKELYDAAWERVVTSSSFIKGEELSLFEQEWASFLGASFYACGCANGTEAIFVAASLLRNQVKKRIALIPAMTFVATAEALLWAGFEVRLVDIDPQTYLMSAEGVASLPFLDEVGLLVPVHLYGQMCDMAALRSLCQKKGILMLEDAAQAQGALWQGNPPSFYSEAATYSFYPGKNLGAFGDAGAIVSQDKDFIESCRIFIDHGRRGKFDSLIRGTNARLDTLQAAILRIRLRRLHEWNERRRQIASLYKEHLKDVSEITLPVIRPESSMVFHQYVIRTQERDLLRQYLKERGIATGLHYPKAIHQLSVFKGYNLGAKTFPNAEKLARECLSLPICPSLTREQVEYVCSQIKAFFSS